MHVKWSVTLRDRLGPEILTVLEIKRQVLHRVCLHDKVPCWLLSLNALLTKKLPRFCHVWMKSVVVGKICVWFRGHCGEEAKSVVHGQGQAQLLRRCETISVSLVFNSQFHAKYLASLTNQNARFYSIMWFYLNLIKHLSGQLPLNKEHTLKRLD